MEDKRRRDARPGSSGAGDPVGDPGERSGREEKSGAETAGEKGDLLGAVGKLANVFAFGKLPDASAAASTADGTPSADTDDDGTGGTGGARRAP
ncbi:hypothetical protein C5E07_00655 [Pseudoclavibacter sp. RFBJ3]|uniref:hypothetical protein n=1 Tax=unclassified Pseudoclavibacter TaxID=2615177 RepID=UPI000CE75B19|nr:MULTISPECIES: hypothetical protein [unclassified Pseudoclavibacter]PPF86489.1 hypothetical protein C5C12_01865 [Pseudoclavibacter sp. RFBJ5]PPF95221.1 hypothetical protein C5E07_00655 [Pseudoclavibacter sp. RFBJ3]PPF97655.1 hypothetical protein C5C19_11335 [Pseudoclavibacter sp. RFBH5]PPG22691.1 hypothetical protein C5E13_10605 [Pseudoclavibacter sp. RFBI4]